MASGRRKPQKSARNCIFESHNREKVNFAVETNSLSVPSLIECILYTIVEQVDKSPAEPHQTNLNFKQVSTNSRFRIFWLIERKKIRKFFFYKLEKYVIKITQRGMGSRNQIFTETLSRQDFGISAYLEFAEKREIQSDNDQKMILKFSRLLRILARHSLKENFELSEIFSYV